MARRVIVHAGFHKTGSTSIQRFLRDNGPLIWPHAALVLPGRLRKGAARMAVRYARFGTAALLDEFARDMGAVLDGLDTGRRALVISDENLAGRMPGRGGQVGYGACPALMGRLAEELRARFGEGLDLRFCFATRAREDWLASLWAHNLRHSRLTEDLAAFRAAQAQAEGWDALLERIRAAVGPARLHVAPLEELAARREGPAALILDRLGLPARARAQLVPQAAQNVSHAAALNAALLGLNRSTLDDAALAARKAALLESPGDAHAG